MTDVYGKLVRDRIPEIIREQGHSPKVIILDEESYFVALKQKLKEEVAEYFEDNDSSELADIAEVVLALAQCKGLGKEEFERLRMVKREERGGFENRLFLLEVLRGETE